MKINLDVENVYGLGVKTTRRQGKLGVTFAWKLMFLEFNQIKRKVNMTSEVLKINLDVENVDGLGGQNSKERRQTRGEIWIKLMCPEFNQINRNEQGDKQNFEN